MTNVWNVEVRIPESSDLEASGETRTLEVRADETILAAARSNELWLPADCQQGWCITCAAKLHDGEVDLSRAKRYYSEDESAGYILTCVAYPRSDLIVTVDQYDAMLRHRADNDQPPGRSKLS